MAYRVEVSPRALHDLDTIAGYITEHGSLEQAAKWLNGMIGAIASLKDLPLRCPVAAESEELGREVRLLLHGKRNRMYKVHFSVHEKTPGTEIVQVLHVRHWAQHELTADEFEQFAE